MKVGICIVFYNDLQHIERLADALDALDYRQFQIYYTDNSINKIHKGLLKQRFPEAFYLESSENTGFAKGNNLLAQAARKNKCEFIWILNPDMAPRTTCLSELIHCLQMNENTEAVGPVLLYGENERNNIVQFGGSTVDFIQQNKYPLYSGLELEKLPKELSQKVDLINGGSLLIKTAWLEMHELFDEDYFMYNDELDLMNRIKKAGKEVRLVFTAVCTHHHDWSKKNAKAHYLMYYYMMRNKIIYWRKNNYSLEINKSIFNYLLKFPVVLRFCLKTAGIRLVYYYYLGLLHGYLGKKGKSKLFES